MIFDDNEFMLLLCEYYLHIISFVWVEVLPELSWVVVFCFSIVTLSLENRTKVWSIQWRIYIQKFAAHAPTPYGTRFFHFYIHFHQKAPVLEIHAPPPYRKPWIRHCNWCCNVVVLPKDIQRYL